MSAVSILRRRTAPATEPAEPVHWLGVAAGATLVAGGLLFIGRQRRTGLAVAAAGAALAVLDQQETLRHWWAQIPDLVEQAQGLIGQVQQKVDDFTSHRDSIAEAFSSLGSAPEFHGKED